MNIEIKDLENSQVEIKGKIEWSGFKLYCDRALSVLAKKVQLKGFRPGKAPKEMLEKAVPRDKVLTEAAEAVLKEKYFEAVKERKLEPLGPPQASILKLAWGNPFQFKLKAAVLPQIDLPDYKAIAKSIERRKVEAAEKEIDDNLRFLQKARAKHNDKPGPAEKGDFIAFIYQSPQIENNKQFNDQFILGEGGMVNGFEEKLLGLKKGAEKEFSIKFPGDYQGLKAGQKNGQSLKGKKVDFQVEIKEVKSMELPPLNDQFAKSIGKFNNLEELKKSIRDGLTAEKQRAEKERRRVELMSALRSKTETALPIILVEAEKQRILQYLKKDIEKRTGRQFSEYLKEIKKDEKELEKELEKEAEKRIKDMLIIKELAGKEGVEVDDKEASDVMEKAIESYPQADRKKIDKQGLKSYYEEIIFQEKVFQKLENF